METRFKKLPRSGRRILRSGWQEKLPIKPILFGILAVILLLLIVLVNQPTDSYLDSAEMDVLRSKGMLRVGVDETLYGLHVDGVGLEAELASIMGEAIFGNNDSVVLVPITRHSVNLHFEDNDIDLALFSASKLSGYSSCDLPFFSDECVLVGYAPEASMTGMEIAVLEGTDSELVLQKYYDEIDGSIVLCPYAAYYDMFVALRAGTVDALCLTRTAAMSHMESGLYIYPMTVGYVSYHAIASEENKTLLDLLDELIYDKTLDGTLQGLYERFDLVD